MVGKTKEIRDSNGKIIKRSAYFVSYNGVWKQSIKWTKKDALAYEAKLKFGTVEKQTKITLNTLYDLYKNENINKIKMRSIITYDKFYILHIKPILGNIVVDKITHKNISEWQDYLVTKNFSNNYLKSIQQFFRTLVNYGLKRDYFINNPFKINFVKSNIHKKTSQLTIWTPEEFHRFISYVDDLEDRVIFMILYLCGLRKGEAMALKIKDVDLVRSTISINDNWDYVNKLTTSPKTKNSIRTVYIVKELKDVIVQLINKYQEYIGYTNEGLLIGYDDHMSATTLQRHHEKYCIEAGVKIITIHEYRHSHVSTLIDMGFNPHQIADRIGDTVEMVNNTYGHLFLEAQERMAKALEDRFKGITKSEVEYKALN